MTVDLVLFQSMYYLTYLKSPPQTFVSQISNVDDPSMADKEAVLASLNINAMTFNKVTSTFHIKAIMITTSAIHTIIIQTDCNTTFPLSTTACLSTLVRQAPRLDQERFTGQKSGWF